MKVLWLEVTTPSAYNKNGIPIGGWQDSLERIVKTIKNLNLYIAFLSDKDDEVKVINGVTYIPIKFETSVFESVCCKLWDLFVKKVLPQVNSCIALYKPDLIHIFGTEWPFGQIANYTSVPIVIHIQGVFSPLNNASYPPGYSFIEQLALNFFSFKRIIKNYRDNNNREIWENKTWRAVSNYMGRTSWDRALSNIMHPGCQYFHVDEALRDVFYSYSGHWQYPNDKKLKIVSTGCSNFWKGPDMLLKTAAILKGLGVDFEWNVAGNMQDEVKKYVERKQKMSFLSCNVNILGFMAPDKLIDLLCNSTLYVQTSYIENSPNSICEAQILGIPVVSTNVGGIPSIVSNGEDGILVPANDPWQMVDAIINLTANKERMCHFSENGRKKALSRHSDEQIRKQIINVYMALTDKAICDNALL